MCCVFRNGCPICPICPISIVDAILTANPLYGTGRQHLCGGFYSETCKVFAFAAEPAIKGCVTHPCSVCQFVFVCAFHCTLMLLVICYKGTKKS